MVPTGIRRNQPEMLKSPFISAHCCSTSIADEVGMRNPATAKIIAVSISVGRFVIIRYLICLYRSTPATLEERLVVSERGESLSPS